MTDSRLRELERCWKETGSGEDEAAWLIEQLRTGELGATKLSLAAFCGHEAAGLACRRVDGRQPLLFEEPSESTCKDMASRWGMDTLLRCSVASAWAVLPIWSAGGPSEGKETVRQALEAIERWILAPTDQHSNEVMHACGRSKAVALFTQEPTLEAGMAAVYAAQAAAGEYLVHYATASIQCACRASSDSGVLSAIREEILPWALGYRDPVKRRVEARKREAAE